MAPILRTARLILLPAHQGDLEALHAHWNDPEVARWLWDGAPVPPDSVALLLDRSTRTFEQSGWGLWTLHLAAADAPLIGVCGLAPFDHAPGVELLYSLAPTHRSKGLATEAATAVLTHAFQTLRLPQVFATTDDGNAPSLRVLHRLGATPTLRIRVGDHSYPCFVLHPPATPNHPGMLL